MYLDNSSIKSSRRWKKNHFYQFSNSTFHSKKQVNKREGEGGMRNTSSFTRCWIRWGELGRLFATGIINLGERRRRRRILYEATMSPEAVSLLLFRITCQAKSHHCSLYVCHFLPRRNFLLLPPPPPPPLHRPLLISWRTREEGGILFEGNHE